MKYLVQRQSAKWAEKRFKLFLALLNPEPESTILDLGGFDGKFFYTFKDMIKDLNLKIIIADINEDGLKIAKERGFETLLLNETGILDLQDKSIDIVFCNSVIEHVTLPKNEIWTCTDEQLFKNKSLIRQEEFANEIKRVGKKYFVQTPHKDFPIEAHTWLPLVNKLNRKSMLNLISFTNKFWIKKTNPDWNLFNEEQINLIFPNTDIIVNKVLNFKKEIIVYKNDNT